MDTFGISQSAENIIFSIFSKYEQILEVILYGSRAKGNYNERSDLDLVICKSKIDRKILGEVIQEINDSNFPYTIDLQVLENISNEKLIEHIERVGEIFYRKA